MEAHETGFAVKPQQTHNRSGLQAAMVADVWATPGAKPGAKPGSLRPSGEAQALEPYRVNGQPKVLLHCQPCLLILGCEITLRCCKWATFVQTGLEIGFERIAHDPPARLGNTAMGLNKVAYDDSTQNRQSIELAA